MSAAALLVLATAPGSAQSPAMQTCRQTVGQQLIQSCMKAGGDTLEGCRAKALPQIRACAAQSADGARTDSAKTDARKTDAKTGVKTGEAPQADRPPPASADGNRNSPAFMLIGQARPLVEQGKMRAALPLLDEAIAKDPASSLAFSWRGRAKSQLGQIPQAGSDFDQALGLDPNNTQALIGRGYVRFVMKDNGGALADLNKAAELEPGNPAVYSSRALVYSDMGEQDRAILELNTSLRVNPRFAPAYGNLGLVYNKLQQFDKAVDAYDKALKLTPGVLNFLTGRGFSFASLGESAKAFSDLNAALAINPKSGRALIGRGRLSLDKGDHAAAIRDFNEALTLGARNVNALLPRARAYELSGNINAAKTDYQTILDIAPSHGVATAGIERLDAKIAAANGAARPAATRAGVRVALVIGNSRYKAVEALPNPERDAKLLADTLGKAGFEKVSLVIDGTRIQLLDALKAFARDAANADWAVVYYAGHGIELDGSNYVVPVDVEYKHDNDIPKESVALDQILNSVAGAGKLRLVILDACRENPFVAELAKKDAAPGKGLARIEPESGTLVAFATKHGHVAMDGGGDNSPFALSLTRRINTPGLEISQLFRLVHDDVFASTAKAQEPFTYGQLSSQAFYFKGK